MKPTCGRPRKNHSGWHVLRLDKNNWLPVRIRQGATGFEAMSYTTPSKTQAAAMARCRAYEANDQQRQVG